LRAFNVFDGSDMGSLFVQELGEFTLMKRFGTDGMVFGGGDRVMFLRSDFIAP
jgi:hypothetical protein